MAVTPTDITVALGRTASPTAAEVAQWGLWIYDAELLIGLRLGDISLLNQDALDYVVREAVLSQVRRPDDATQVDIAIDDGRVSRRYSSASGRVSILDEWWDLLSPSSASDAFSITPYATADTASVLTPWDVYP